MKVLMLGGCHTYAYGTNDYSKGYYQKFLEKLKTDGVEIDEISYAPIAVGSVNKLIEEGVIKLEEFDLILLQLGNYEFETTISEIPKLFFPKKKKNSIFKSEFYKPLNESLITERRNAIYDEKINTPSQIFLKKIFSHVLTFFLKGFILFKDIPRYKRDQILFERLSHHLSGVSKKIIYIGVFPSVYPLRHFLRKLGSIYLERMCKLSNIQYINLMDLNEATFFIEDGIHFNENGHSKIYQRLVESYKLLFDKRSFETK